MNRVDVIYRQLRETRDSLECLATVVHHEAKKQERLRVEIENLQCEIADLRKQLAGEDG